MVFSKRLRTLRLKAGYTQVELAKSIGCSTSVYLTLENGTRIPKTQLLEKIALFYQVSLSYLLCETNLRTRSDIEKLLEELSENEQQKTINYIQNIHDQKTVTNSEKYTLQLFTYDVLDQLLLPCMVLPKNVQIGHTLVYWNKDIDYDLALWIKGDSMSPVYTCGEVVLIKKQSLVDYEGQVCVVNYDGNTYIKKVYPKSAGLQLVSINKNHHDFFYLGLKNQ